MRRDQRIEGPRQVGDIGTQLLGAQGAVQTDGERIGVAHRMPEGFRRLARQGAARQIGDGAGNPHRQAHTHLLIDFLDGIDRRLAVQRVEHGFDHQQVGAAADQAARAFAIGFAQLVEGDVAEGRIVDVGRDRGRAVGRAQHAGHQARTAAGAEFIAQFARQPGAGFVQFPDQMAQAVILLAGKIGVEGIGFDKIDARFQILAADVPDDLRLGQGEKVVVALQVRRMIAETLAPEILFTQLEALDHHAPRAVQQQQAFLRLFLHPGNAGFAGK